MVDNDIGIFFQLSADSDSDDNSHSYWLVIDDGWMCSITDTTVITVTFDDEWQLSSDSEY